MYTLSTPSGVTVHRSCLCARLYERSGYGQRSWFTTARLHDIVIAPGSSPGAYQGPAPLPDTVIISRHRHKNTPNVAHAAFAHVAEKARPIAFGGIPYGAYPCLLKNAWANMGVWVQLNVAHFSLVQYSIVTDN